MALGEEIPSARSACVFGTLGVSSSSFPGTWETLSGGDVEVTLVVSAILRVVLPKDTLTEGIL